MKIKIRRREVEVGKHDTVLDNGACFILMSQSVGDGFHKYNPTINKAQCKKWIKDGTLEFIGLYNKQPNMKLYRFNV